MTAPLDENGLEAAHNVLWPATEWNDGEHACRETVSAAIRAYLAASPSPSEMEVVAWMHPTAGWARTKYHSILPHCQKSGRGPVALVRQDQAQSALAARDAQVLRLTEENEALRKERTSLIETKREQIDRLTADRDHNAAEYEKVLNSYADENQCFSDKLEAAEARIRDLEDEKAKALALLDHLVDWIVHDCGAEVPFSGEQDETYTTLQKEQADG